MNYNPHKVTINETSHGRDGEIYVMGFVRYEPIRNVRFVFACDGIEDGRMKNVNIEFIKGDNFDPIEIPYSSDVFNAICHTCFQSIINYRSDISGAV